MFFSFAGLKIKWWGGQQGEGRGGEGRRKTERGRERLKSPAASVPVRALDGRAGDQIRGVRVG